MTWKLTKKCCVRRLVRDVYIGVYIYIYIKVKCSRYRPGVAQRVGRGIALLFHDRCTRREWVVSSTPRPHFTPGKDPVPILQEAGWALGSVWTGGKSRPHRDSIVDRPTRSQSLYRLSYPGNNIYIYIYKGKVIRGTRRDQLSAARPGRTLPPGKTR